MRTLQHEDVAKILGTDRPARRRMLRWRWITAIVVAAAAAAGWYVLSLALRGEAARYITVPVERGTLTVTVTATGTLAPVNDVEISSELSGIVRTVLVDFNDTVRAGQVLAELDTDKLRAEVAHARATLASAQAKVKEAEAALAQARADFERYRRLAETRAASEQRYQEAKATYDRTLAALDGARADVLVAQANLDLKETDLRKALIRSPIDGIVLDRRVDPGQTVAATLQAPVLFTVAETLTAMELQVVGDEADIGLVDVGQAAQFTVDSYPDRTFSGVVTKVRYAPRTVEGVVTYTAHIAVDNGELLLRPGMTATAEITVRTVRDAVLVPNEALRFTPPQPSAETGGGGLVDRILPRAPSRMRTRDVAERGHERQVWGLEEGQPVAVTVEIGLSDGERTEVLRGLDPGRPVIVDVTSPVS
ncbi:MAG: efflux RND transporter periplasmic adaptor subunit [Rhodospirillaceae bacterium]|nr:efflux RND transporter periplasmic adaptor subunit [Rhodospirillaceae bacterium]